MSIQEHVRNFHGLKWNPFSGEIPVKALSANPAMESFFYRVENLVLDGGFALITGPSGMGKSVTLRMLSQRLGEISELQVGSLIRPQSGISDFYRELGAVFGIDMRMNNRWGGYKSLRNKWLHHTKSTTLKPVLIIDEAQEVPEQVLVELRLLTSENYDSTTMLSVILAGDNRIHEKLSKAQLIPLATRIKTQHQITMWSIPELMKLLEHNLEQAGNTKLITQSTIKLIAEHSAGSPRRMNYLANELLVIAAEKRQNTIDEKTFMTQFGKMKQGREPGVQRASELKNKQSLKDIDF